ncbi:MAG: cytochrome ubiquinol oxidase subunit I [Fusobacteria bacterium]|nr:cytochrome ubiquinol oxidase subunit I [Fusobacteriota bacterium]
MDLVMLSRIQFGTTTVFHFFFVPLTIGLALLIAILQTAYYKTGRDEYKKLTKYFGGIFLINFAVGVGTGLVQEFEFGMNWAGYSRFVGDIFGAPLAVEALLAFFIESTFIGVWIFGWDRISKKIHLLSIWLVAISTILSAYWIIVANSFMQHPVGYKMMDGKPEMTSFWTLITNPHAFIQFPHVVFGAITTAAGVMIAVSAFNISRGFEVKIFKKSMLLGLVAGIIALALTLFIGDAQGKYLVQTQPMKMAAAEALWNSEQPAALSVFAIPDSKTHSNKMDFKIPDMLSFMSYSNFTGKVVGINELQAQEVAQYGPGNYIPPVGTAFWCFRAMVYLGTLAILIWLGAIFLFWRRKLETNNKVLAILMWTALIPYICNSTGWILAEVGRQPWIVYGLQKTTDGVSATLKPEYVATSLIGFILIYILLIILALFLTFRYIRLGGVNSNHQINDEKGDDIWC